VAIPPTMQRPRPTGAPVPGPGGRQKRGTPQPGSTSPLAALATAARNGPSRPRPAAPAGTDSLVPRPHSAAPARGAGLRLRVATLARRHRRRILVLVVVAIALAMSVVAVWPVLFRSGASTSSTSVRAAREAVATDLLLTVVGGGRSLWSPHHSFAGVAPATLSNFSYAVPVVAATTTARLGAVSMRVNDANEITLATPADTGRCVFARDEPATTGTRFVTVDTHTCRASAAPAAGWASR
jgi:hypothetical protein